MAPGYRCCYLSYKHVPVLISRNSIRFASAIERVPTKDNALVALDIGINLHIGRTDETLEEDAKRFFYNFGPNRLEELLQQEADEGFRNFCRGIKVANIKNAKTEICV